MWIKNYKDYPADSMIKQEQVSSGNGIIGCEMHEQMGYGTSHDIPVKNPRFFQKLLQLFRR